MARRGLSGRSAVRSANRGIRERVQVPERVDAINGPFKGTMQAGPARPVRAHGLSDEHQDRGLLYVERQVWDEAIHEFEKAVELTPDFSEGWNNLGLCYLYVGRIAEAVEALNEAVRHFPGWHLAIANLGLAYHKARDVDKAMQYYRQALNKQRNQPQVWEALGECYEGMSKLDEAVDAYRSAIEMARDYDLALYRLGMLLARRAELDEADQHLSRAITLNPDYTDALGVLGAIAARRGRLEEARRYYEQARDANPGQPPATALRGIAALNFFEKEVEKNFGELEPELQNLPSIAEVMYNAGLVYMRAGNHMMARTSFQTAAEEDPQWVEPRLWLGVVESLESNPIEARRHFEEVVRLAPDNGYAMEGIALSCISMGLNSEAQRFFDKAAGLGRATGMPNLQ